LNGSPCVSGFNPRPRAGATSKVQSPLADWMFQSTPPRGGDNKVGELAEWDDVSIHAPARGRLETGSTNTRFAGFNPRPRAGATAGACTLSRGTACFNPRPRAGATFCGFFHPFRSVFQSTPPRGGDPRPEAKRKDVACFNPRPRAGATSPPRCSLFPSPVSIHAPARGRRNGCGRDRNQIYCFNPRPRAGATGSVEGKNNA